MTKVRVLFVCLGNICRSPLARALFQKHLVSAGLENGYTSDSAGTSGYHIGESADPRTIKSALQHGLKFQHFARQFHPADFEDFDHIVVMDQSNYRDVHALATAPHHSLKIRMMREFDPVDRGAEVPDPWFGGEEGFEEVYAILHRSTAGLLTELQKKM